MIVADIGPAIIKMYLKKVRCGKPSLTIGFNAQEQTL